MGRSEELQNHSEDLIEQLVNEGKLSLAVDVHENTVKNVPAFQLGTADMVYKFAQVYQERLQYTQALELLSQLTRRFPDYPDIGAAILQAAKLYAGHLNQTGKAVPLLRYVIKSNKFDEGLKQQAKEFLNVILQ
jgi:tetratricopeptide (TPR) repeat protein